MRGTTRRAVLAAVAVVAAVVAVPAFAAGGKTVYTISNSSTGNAVLSFERGADGSLTPTGSTPTGGLGSGGGLGSQGAVVLGRDGKHLFAVNAASDSVSSFAVTKEGLRLVDTAPSGADDPISLTEHKGLLYVLNAGTHNSISGLEVSRHGDLTPLPGSTQPLSREAASPAQVEFDPRGDVLVVSEKDTNLLTTYVVDRNGLAGPPRSSPSTGVTPFGFAFTKHGVLIVSNAATTGASSYAVGRSGEVDPISSVSTGEGAACWTVVTRDGRFAYTTNTAAGTISAYAVDNRGSLSLVEAVAARTGGSPSDAAITGDGHFLYVRNGGQGGLNAFRIGADGELTPIAGTSGLPAGFAGLAAS